jgi:hypothetical protein
MHTQIRSPLKVVPERLQLLHKLAKTLGMLGRDSEPVRSCMMKCGDYQRWAFVAFLRRMFATIRNGTLAQKGGAS